MTILMSKCQLCGKEDDLVECQSCTRFTCQSCFKITESQGYSKQECLYCGHSFQKKSISRSVIENIRSRYGQKAVMEWWERMQERLRNDPHYIPLTNIDELQEAMKEGD